MALERIDLILKISMIHSRESGISRLDEFVDIIIKKKITLSVFSSLFVRYKHYGLNIKQKYLFVAMIRELSVKIKHVDLEMKARIYNQYKLCHLSEIIEYYTKFHQAHSSRDSVTVGKTCDFVRNLIIKDLDI